MDYFTRMLSADSSASYGRFASFLALVCLLIWVSLIIGKTNTIPDIPASWLAIVGIPFGITKIAEVIKGGGNADTPPQ